MSFGLNRKVSYSTLPAISTLHHYLFLSGMRYILIFDILLLEATTVKLWTDWSPWSVCTKTCGQAGFVSRKRDCTVEKCLNPSSNGSFDVDKKPCKFIKCPCKLLKYIYYCSLLKCSSQILQLQ